MEGRQRGKEGGRKREYSFNLKNAYRLIAAKKQARKENMNEHAR